MNFDNIDNLSKEDILKLYDDIIESNSFLSAYYVYMNEVECSDGTVINDVSVCTNSMQEKKGSSFTDYYKNPAYTCYQICPHSTNGFQQGCTMSGYHSYSSCTCAGDGYSCPMLEYTSR